MLSDERVRLPCVCRRANAARICVCGSVRFRPEQICAVTDSVSEQQRSVHLISTKKLRLSPYLRETQYFDTVNWKTGRASAV